MKSKRNTRSRLVAGLLVGLMLLSSCAPAEPVPPETEDEAVQETLPQTETEVQTETEAETATETEAATEPETATETETATEPETETETKGQEFQMITETISQTKLFGGVPAKRVYYVDSPSSVGEKFALATLQGLAAKHSETQILIKAGATGSYLPYLENWGCEVLTQIEGEAITLKKLMEQYGEEGFVKGYILIPAVPTTANEESWNVAASLAGVLDAVVINPVLKKTFEELGYACLLDATGKDDQWLRNSEYWELLSRDTALVQSATSAPRLIDYAVKCGAYVNYYRGSSQREHMDLYDFLHDNAVVLGYNNTLGEGETVASLSSIHVSMIPADHACNISTLSGFRTESMTQKRGETADETAEKNVHTVCIMLSDGDNMQWVLNDFVSSRWYGSPLRGKVTMGWGMPAMAIELISPMMAYLYDTMTEQDEFVMQLSGLGYTFPSKWQKEQRLQMAKELASYMKRSDLPYAEILDAGGFKESVLEDFTVQDGIEGLFYIDYNNYAGHSGKIIWTNGKPTVAARYRLWGGMGDGTIDMISRRVNRASTDPTKEGAYSFIIAHAWSGMKDGKFGEGGSTVEAIAALIESFDEDVEVVTPSEFMRRIQTNLGEGK